MKRVLKTMFFVGGAAAAGYFGFKVYRTVQTMNLLEKSLPGHLESLCGEVPEVKGGITINKNTVLSLKISLSPEALAKLGDVNETVLDYIRENYPSLIKYKIIIKAEVPEAEDSYISGAHHNDPEEG